ncbi:hypothetical protein [Caldivirga sp.]|uniref:hypothetical protein n=1 Tax=Caldivirga sp. TaxID=2080243 RepID=UPI0025C42D57|nr:hypothetical protein [Caldivirga sp.]
MPIAHTPFNTVELPNATIVRCINSTFGYINLTSWQTLLYATYPGTSDYDLALEVIFSWFHYFVPTIPFFEKLEPYEYRVELMDPNWLFQGYILDHYPWLTYELEVMT